MDRTQHQHNDNNNNMTTTTSDYNGACPRVADAAATATSTTACAVHRDLLLLCWLTAIQGEHSGDPIQLTEISMGKVFK